MLLLKSKIRSIWQVHTTYGPCACSSNLLIRKKTSRAVCFKIIPYYTLLYLTPSFIRVTNHSLFLFAQYFKIASIWCSNFTNNFYQNPVWLNQDNYRCPAGFIWKQRATKRHQIKNMFRFFIFNSKICKFLYEHLHFMYMVKNILIFFDFMHKHTGITVVQCWEHNIALMVLILEGHLVLSFTSFYSHVCPIHRGNRSWMCIFTPAYLIFRLQIIILHINTFW